MKGVRKCHANENQLATQKGNLTVAQQEDKKLEERLVLTGKETLAKPPTWLIDARAKMNLKDL